MEIRLIVNVYESVLICDRMWTLKGSIEETMSEAIKLGGKAEYIEEENTLVIALQKLIDAGVFCGIIKP